MRFRIEYLCVALLACSAHPTVAAQAPDPSENLGEQLQPNMAEKQFASGQRYKHGHNGTNIDLDKAEALFGLAAASGYEPAEDEYGLILFQNGKERDALPWLEKAASRGEPRAQYLLGTALFNGASVPKDWPRAYALMLRSTASGLDQAGYTLAQMDQFIPLEERRHGATLAQQMETAQTDALSRFSDAPGASYDPPGIIQPPAPAALALSPIVPPADPDMAETPEEPPLPAVEKPLSVDKKRKAAPPYFTDETKPASAPSQSTQGRWRIQLGAFRDKGRAPALWQKIHAAGALHVDTVYYFVSSGNLTRLLAGPFKNSAEAGAACRRLQTRGHTACLPIAP